MIGKLTLAQHKGGVGKTVLSGNISLALARRGGYRTLAVDMDPQANLTYFLGFAPYPGTYDFLVRDEEFDRVRRAVSPQRYGGEQPGLLHVIGGNIETDAINRFVPDSATLDERLAELVDEFDYVVIDTPPTHARSHALVFTASDWILSPTDCDAFSLKGLREILSAVEKKRRVRVMGIVPNKIRAIAEDREIEADLRGQMGDLVWPTLSLASVWKEATNRQVAVFHYAPYHHASHRLWDIVDRIESWGAA